MGFSLEFPKILSSKSRIFERYKKIEIHIFEKQQRTIYDIQKPTSAN